MNMNQKTIDQVIALAGISQSIRAVQNIAWKGDTNTNDLKSVLLSLLQINAKSAASVYNSSFELSSGLRLIKQQLDANSNGKDTEFVGLLINVLSLQKQLSKNNTIMALLTKKISQLSTQYENKDYEQDDSTFEQLLIDCSDIYQQTVSKLPTRIQVKGEPKYLKENKNQIKVRAALLCAMRSAFLWRQSGGSRWNFLFHKQKILDAVNFIIKNPQK